MILAKLLFLENQFPKRPRLPFPFPNNDPPKLPEFPNKLCAGLLLD